MATRGRIYIDLNRMIKLIPLKHTHTHNSGIINHEPLNLNAEL